MKKDTKMTLREFKETYMGKNSKWDWSKFSIVCNKCKSNKIEFNGMFESEEGYYGDSSLEGGIVIKCHTCGNAFKIDNWDADAFNTNADERLEQIKYEVSQKINKSDKLEE